MAMLEGTFNFLPNSNTRFRQGGIPVTYKYWTSLTASLYSTCDPVLLYTVSQIYNSDLYSVGSKCLEGSAINSSPHGTKPIYTVSGSTLELS